MVIISNDLFTKQVTFKQISISFYKTDIITHYNQYNQEQVLVSQNSSQERMNGSGRVWTAIFGPDLCYENAEPLI